MAAARHAMSTGGRLFHSTARTAAAFPREIPTKPKALYRSLLRAVQAFPPEPLAEINKDHQTFSDAGAERIRSQFRMNAGADVATATKLISSGGKELEALYTVLQNDHLHQYPGPEAVKTLHSQ
mmetsp:Transcript_66479/g.138562  ORF Transcript_66479/g.138562 Transcript_66479/m.138562 type:complete len:124 (+) Transcript_66479:29-400(+)